MKQIAVFTGSVMVFAATVVSLPAGTPSVPTTDNGRRLYEQH